MILKKREFDGPGWAKKRLRLKLKVATLKQSQL
jgi:hypothetical protein